MEFTMLAGNWLEKFMRQFKSAHRPSRILLKYILLQIPALALVILALVLVQKWLTLPKYVLWGLPILWILKDIVLFPLTWRSYESHSRHALHPMVGRYGIAQQPLAPSGYVRIGAELWLAESVEEDQSIEKGEWIRVREVNGLKLLVDRKDKTSDG